MKTTGLRREEITARQNVRQAAGSHGDCEGNLYVRNMEYTCIFLDFMFINGSIRQ
jgi:hypothetical protein